MVFVYMIDYRTVHHDLSISQTVCTMSGSAVASWLVNSTLGQVVQVQVVQVQALAGVIVLCS